MADYQSDCGRYNVHVPQAVIDQMIQTAVEHLPNEVGTAMYGHYSDNQRNAVIDGLCPVTADSQGTPTSFNLGVEGLNDFFAEKWASEKQFFVGDWHSHPYGPDYLSKLDINAIKGIAEDEEMLCPEVLSLILGGDMNNSPSMTCAVFSRKNGLVRLKEASPVAV